MKRLTVCCLALCASTAAARVWTDDTGVYTVAASLVAFDEAHAVLKRDTDGEMGMVDLERLSPEDRAFIDQQRSRPTDPEEQLWKLRSGLEVPARVVDYARRDVTVSRKRGKVFVNNRVFENLPAVYRRIVPLIVGEQTGNQVEDEDSLKKWLVHLKGQPQTFSVDGVVMELASGDEYALPFFLFDDDSLRVLQPGWESWLAANGQTEADYDQRAELSLALQTRANNRDAMQAEQLRIAKLQLGMAAVDAGVTSLWEVTLYPGAGMGGSPMWVVSPGRDSRAATAEALARNPGYVPGPVRRLSR